MEGGVEFIVMVDVALRLFIPPSPVLSPVTVPGYPGVVSLVPWGPGRLVALTSRVLGMFEPNMVSSRRSAVNVMLTLYPWRRRSM